MCLQFSVQLSATVYNCHSTTCLYLAACFWRKRHRNQPCIVDIRCVPKQTVGWWQRNMGWEKQQFKSSCLRCSAMFRNFPRYSKLVSEWIVSRTVSWFKSIGSNVVFVSFVFVFFCFSFIYFTKCNCTKFNKRIACLGICFILYIEPTLRSH